MKLRVAVVGVTGYVGGLLVAILLRHSYVVSLEFFASSESKGVRLSSIFPFFVGFDLPPVRALEDLDPSAFDVVFFALPHTKGQPYISSLLRKSDSLRVIDMSADFRLAPHVYEDWYGVSHCDPDLCEQAVYAVSEHVDRSALGRARIIANPGCYATAVQMPIVPLLRSKLIAAEGLVVDAKSGVSGAGRSLSHASLFCEIADNFRPYSLLGHRHVAEIEQEMAHASGVPSVPPISFVPHLLPISRGILATMYVRLLPDVSYFDLQEALKGFYQDSAFVLCLENEEISSIAAVRGTNRCVISVHPSRLEGCAVIVSALDNLVKGASGQGVQNMNLWYGIQENIGLDVIPPFC